MYSWLQASLANLQAMSPWEATAVLLAIAYLLFAIREKVLCWLFAFISTAIYTVLFWDVSLLMDSALNLYYMAMAVYGWYQWTYGGTGDSQHSLKIRSMSRHQHSWMIATTIIFSAGSGYLLSKYSHAAWPYIDSFTTWASVFTTYLVARKYLQNWLYWIVIDAISVPLYIDRGLSLTALLFVAYIVIATVGYFSWRAHLRTNEQVNAA